LFGKQKKDKIAGKQVKDLPMGQKALVAEFIGTCALVFMTVGAIAVDSMTGGKLGLLGIALVYGVTVAAMVSATSPISGGHLNPAVTFGALVAGKTDGKTAVSYIVVQCLGALVGSLLIEFAIPVAALVPVAFGIPALGPGITPFQALLTETLLTFLLMFVFYGTVIDHRAPKAGGLFVGMAVGVGVLVGGPITGGAMNPARYFGPAIITFSFQDFWIYWVGPLAGALLSALIYKLILERD
jgi:MIP family channel proteins